MIAGGFDQIEFVKLLNIPSIERGEKWEKDFLDQLPYCKFDLISDIPQEGPDQFPYMYIEIKDNSQTPIFQILNWICKAGVGLAINPKKEFPDYVFTYGMIWNFIKMGQFYSDPTLSSEDLEKAEKKLPINSEVSITPGTTLFVGEPSKEYLPPEVRQILKEFLKQQGVMAPKILMLSQDNKHFDFCFSAESFGSPDAKEYEGVLQALSWFLPPHYSLAMVSEQGLPQFFEL